MTRDGRSGSRRTRGVVAEGDMLELAADKRGKFQDANGALRAAQWEILMRNTWGTRYRWSHH